MRLCHAYEPKQDLLINKISVHLIGLIDHIKLCLFLMCVNKSESHRIHRNCVDNPKI